MKQQKILILDGIPQVLLGIEFFQALKSLFNDTYYLAQKDFDQKYFYGLRASVAKKISKKSTNYVHPKLPISSFKKKLESIRPTIVLVIGFCHHLISKEHLAALKRQFGFQLVLWDTDSANYCEPIKALETFIHDEFMRYDKIFSFSSAMVHYMNRLNLIPFEYLHFGSMCYPHLSNASPREKTIDLCFSGIPNIRRLFFLSEIKNKTTCIVGKRWERIKSILPENIQSSCTYTDSFGESFHETLFRSKIIANITNSYFYSLHSGLTLRFFETLALKGFLLTDNLQEIQELFVPGKELEIFSSYEEFVDKVKFYSEHDEARNKIAEAGYEKFINHYTWQHQAKKLLHLLGI